MINSINAHLLENIQMQYSDANKVDSYTCKSCNQLISVYRITMLIGPRKGTELTQAVGCKCEDIALGRAVVARKRELMRLEQEERFFTFSLLNDDLEHATLQSYEPKTTSQREALESCCGYVRQFEDKFPGNLLLSGNTGVGKSHLAYGVVKALMSRGMNGLFISVPHFLTAIKSTYKHESKVSEYDLINRLKEAPILVLDDLGSEYKKEDVSGWAVAKVFEVIDARLGRPTIYTTNLDLLQLRNDYARGFSHAYSTKRS